MSDEKLVSEATTVANFLNDPAIKAAIERLTKKYYLEFVQSKSADSRESAWAKARVLEDLATELLAVVDAGKVATARLNRPAPRQR